MSEEYHDDDTLFKVYKALEESGASRQQAIDMVSAMQNRGILFRERHAD